MLVVDSTFVGAGVGAGVGVVFVSFTSDTELTVMVLETLSVADTKGIMEGLTLVLDEAFVVDIYTSRKIHRISG